MVSRKIIYLYPRTMLLSQAVYYTPGTSKKFVNFFPRKVNNISLLLLAPQHRMYSLYLFRHRKQECPTCRVHLAPKGLTWSSQASGPPITLMLVFEPHYLLLLLPTPTPKAEPLAERVCSCRVWGEDATMQQSSKGWHTMLHSLVP